MKVMASRFPARSGFLNDLRSLVLLLVGTSLYLLLFSLFGRADVSTIAVDSSPEFPRKLWQTWRVDPASLAERDAQRVRTWFKHSPDLRYEALTDGNALAYVKKVFGPSQLDRPDFVHVYESLQADILKADLLRYMVMYVEGGVYADIDVEALAPFSDFIPDGLHERDIDMIIGVETDQPAFIHHPILGVKAQSFCQWTLVCKKRLPLMLSMIENIILWLDRYGKEQKKGISELEFNFDAVLNGTGPSAFTTNVLSEMTRRAGRNIDWTNFHDLREPKVVERILVLPAQAFAANTGHSNSGTYGSTVALVKHHYGASGWPKLHSRTKHPLYDSVEGCNWDAECVKLWDMNTAKFDALPKEDQLKMIAAKFGGRPIVTQTDELKKPESDAEATQEKLKQNAKTNTVEDVDNHETEYDASKELDIPDIATLEKMIKELPETD